MSTDITTPPATDQQKVVFGPGSAAGLSGVAGAWIAFIVAAVNAGGNFYTDNGVIGLLITAVTGTMAFFALRLPKVQGGFDKGVEVHDQIEAKYQQLLAEYQAQLAHFQEIVSGIEDDQDAVPDGIKDEVTTEAPGDEATDGMKPPA